MKTIGVELLESMRMRTVNDSPMGKMAAKLIPPGNRGNIIITNKNKVSFREQNWINGEARSHIDALPEDLQAAKRLVIELGYIPQY